LADLASIRRFADVYAGAHDSLDLLVNNAGVMGIPRRETADGFEMQFGTNHLGHFALTAHLLDSLLARPGARVVTVSSAVAQVGRIRFDDLQGTGKYGKWSAYSQAKLANQLFTLELDRRASRHGVDLVSVAAHPGYAATNLQSVGPQMSGSGLMERLTDLGNKIFGQSAAGGALPSLYGATAPGVTGGQYFGPDGFMAQRGAPTAVSFVKAAKDPAVARRLWEVSEELTGATFGVLDDEG
jgi:NAD(P)-dependent dehydrogenase (short-subunit alcohol dehydrogenase family)